VRFKYYIATYTVGYIASVYGTGVPYLYYLIPIKLVAICLMLVAGNGIYYMAEEKQQMLQAFLRTVKYIIFSFILLFISALLHSILRQYYIDLKPFIGM